MDKSVREVPVLDLPLSPTQVESLRESTARVNLWEGSIRSGKTLASLLRWLIFTATAPYGGQLVVVARTRDTAYRNVFAPLMDETLFGSIARQVSYTAGAPTASVLGRTVFVIGASDAKAEKVLRGLTVAGAYVDEVTVIPEEFFTQLLGRMSVPGAQLFGTTNPDNPAHWLKAKFLDRLRQLPDWRSFHFTLRDNPSLTPEYIDSITREFTGLWYRRFILGEWVAAEGAIFPMWDPETDVVAWGDLPEFWQLISVGVDYGTTNATAAVLLGLGIDRNLYLVDEWRHDSKQSQTTMTDADLSQALKGWISSPRLPHLQALSPQYVCVDPAAASLKAQMYRDEIPGVINADNDVAYGIRTVASLLGQRLLKVTDRCAGLITEFPSYAWDDKATLRGEDKPIKVADHSLDAMRYAITTTENLWRDEIGPRELIF